MTPGMQLRLWLRTAARTQVAGAAVALVAVIALLVASVSRGTTPGGTDALGDVVAGGTTGATVQGGSTGVVVGPGGGLPAPGASTGPGTTGGLALGTTGAGAGSGSGTAGGGFTTGGGSSTSGTGGPPYDISRATDRGVNNCPGVKACVKVGFLVAKIGGLDQSGFALNLRGDISQVIDAYVAYQNKHGGINGRTIVAEKRTTDPIDQTDQQNACTEMTQDQKVFGVIDTASLIFAVTQKCFTQDTKTPLVHSYAESEAFMNAAHGYDLTEIRSLDRIAIEWADEIGKLGFLKGGEKVGILEDNCEPSHSIVDKLLVGGIKKYKPASVKTYESDCTAASAQAQPPALQNQMCIDGVTHVLLATSFVAAQTFLQSADAGPCGSGARKYTYMASDYSLLASDLFTHNFSRTQFDGSLAITNQFTGIKAVSPRLSFCSKILKDAGLPGLDNSYPNNDATAICDYFFLFVKAATAAGPNLTRAGWALAAQHLGQFDGAFSPRSVYQPGKTNGGELVHAMVWLADCTCYRASGPLHPGLG